MRIWIIKFNFRTSSSRSSLHEKCQLLHFAANGLLFLKPWLPSGWALSISSVSSIHTASRLERRAMEATALSVGKSVLSAALGYAKSALAEEVALTCPFTCTRSLIECSSRRCSEWTRALPNDHEFVMEWTRQSRQDQTCSILPYMSRKSRDECNEPARSENCGMKRLILIDELCTIYTHRTDIMTSWRHPFGGPLGGTLSGWLDSLVVYI